MRLLRETAGANNERCNKENGLHKYTQFERLFAQNRFFSLDNRCKFWREAEKSHAISP
jgi:hypothetical protein